MDASKKRKREAAIPPSAIARPKPLAAPRGGSAAPRGAKGGAAGATGAAASASAGAAFTAGDVFAGIDALISSIPGKRAARAAVAAEEAAAAEARRATMAAMRAAHEARVASLEAAGQRANRTKASDSPQPQRFDAALGVNIFSIDALKIGRGSGSTPACPFDCACCF